MFPAMLIQRAVARRRFGGGLLDRLDLVVELATLGEYGLAEDGLPLALQAGDEPDGGPESSAGGPLTVGVARSAVAQPDRRAPRDDCPLRGCPSSAGCGA